MDSHTEYGYVWTDGIERATDGADERPEVSNDEYPKAVEAEAEAET